MAPRQLVEPDVGALREEDESGHPLAVLGEALDLGLGADERRCLTAPDRAAAEPLVKAALFLGQDPDRQVDLRSEPIEGGTEQPAPVVANVPQLAGERVGELAGRLAQELEERESVAGTALEDLPGLVALDRPNRRREARSRQAPLVDEVPEGVRGRIVVGQVDEDQVLESGGGLLVDPREGGREGSQERRCAARAGFLPDRRERGADGGLRPAAGGLDDREMSDLVEQAEGEELAGERLTLARLALRVQRADDPAGRGRRQGTGRRHAVIDREPLQRRAEEGNPLHWPSVACRRRDGSRGGDGSADRHGLPAARGDDVLDRAAEQLEPGRVELVRPAPDPLGPLEPAFQAVGDRLAGQEDDVGRAVDQVELPVAVDRRRQQLDAGRPRQGERLAHVLGAALRRADQADARARRETGDLVDELHVARPDEHGHDRHAAVDERLGLVGVERRRRDEVVVEPLEPIGQVVEERPLDVDQLAEGLDQTLGVVAGVGVRALGEEDLDLGSRALPLARRGERGRRHLVGPEPGLRRPPEHLRDDPGQGLRPASLRRAVRHVGAGPVSTRDVTGVGQTSIDRADRVGIHSECGTHLPHGGKTGAGQEPAGIDLVGELPEDLGRDRDIGIALDVDIAGGTRHAVVGGSVIVGTRQLSY